MARRSAAAARLRKPVGTGLGGLHPVFGPVADPGPDIGGGWGGWGGGGGGWGGWHGGPVADPGPGFWRGSILGALDLTALAPEAMKQLSEFRVRRINASISALEEQLAIAKSEFDLVSRFAGKVQIDRLKIPPFGPGDPVPELRAIEFIRFIYDLRVAPIQRTIDFLKASAKAVEAAG